MLINGIIFKFQTLLAIINTVYQMKPTIHLMKSTIRCITIAFCKKNSFFCIFRTKSTQ